MNTRDAAGTAGCNDRIPDPLRLEDLARLEALERRADAFEARIARELLELKDWTNAQLQELARRIEAQATRHVRMQAELEELRAQLRRVESELRTLTRAPSPPAETAPVCTAALRDLPTQDEPEVQVEQVGSEHEDPGTGAEGAQLERQDLPQMHEHASTQSAHDRLTAGEPQDARSDSVQTASLVPLDGSVEVAKSRGASMEPLTVPHPSSFRERIEAAEARIEAGRRAVDELKGDVIQRVGGLLEKLGKVEEPSSSDAGASGP